jgi:hypothetical protein
MICRTRQRENGDIGISRDAGEAASSRLGTLPHKVRADFLIVNP